MVHDIPPLPRSESVRRRLMRRSWSPLTASIFRPVRRSDRNPDFYVNSALKVSAATGGARQNDRTTRRRHATNNPSSFVSVSRERTLCCAFSSRVVSPRSRARFCTSTSHPAAHSHRDSRVSVMSIASREAPCSPARSSDSSAAQRKSTRVSATSRDGASSNSARARQQRSCHGGSMKGADNCRSAGERSSTNAGHHPSMAKGVPARRLLHEAVAVV